MASVCVQRVATPINEYIVFGFDLYPLMEGQACPSDGYVLLDPTQAQQVLSAASGSGAAGSSNSLPPSADIAAAWGVGFVMVVGCYVIARSVGAVVNMLK